MIADNDARQTGVGWRNDIDGKEGIPARKDTGRSECFTTSERQGRSLYINGRIIAGGLIAYLCTPWNHTRRGVPAGIWLKYVVAAVLVTLKVTYRYLESPEDSRQAGPSIRQCDRVGSIDCISSDCTRPAGCRERRVE